jgi:hypothetical protein
MANYTKKVDGVTITLTDAEQTAREAEEKTAADGKPAKAFASLRLERDIKLSKCDWTVANDTPLSDSVKAKWVTYRKALRNFPGTLDNTKILKTITWPDAPS